jgi:hypothetical protein
MKTQHKFTRALTAALAAATLGTGALAAGPTECSLIGTWYGNAGDDMYWLGNHTAGSTNVKGALLMDWVGVNPRLMGPGATRLTGGHGVWEQTGRGQYKYTWYAYSVDPTGQPLYAIRVKGLATTTTCDRVDIGYAYEIFAIAGWPQDYSGDALYSTSGSAMETRAPLAP